MTFISRRHWLLALVALVALSGCGQKGPLYIPGPGEDADETDGDEEQVRHATPSESTTG